MGRLYPELEDPGALPEAASAGAELFFKVEPVFDFSKGCFRVSPTGRILEVSGEDALWQWVEKTLLTPRYQFPVYDRSYGCEAVSFLGAGWSRETIESELTRAIREALIFDNRVQAVDSFKFTWKRDAVIVSFRVRSVLGGERFFSVAWGV